MIDFSSLLNTCQILAGPVRTIATFSHVVPVVLSLILGFFVFFKAKYNLLSKLFLSFILAFSLWLIGDVIIWDSNNYYLVYSIWSTLVYIEIVFYTIGLYFAIVFVRKADVSNLVKLLMFLCTLPAFFITISKQSVFGFYHPVCEAYNNNFLDLYKLVYEAIILLIMLGYLIAPFFKNNLEKIKKSDVVVLGSMFSFLLIFGATEYIAGVTGYYEINLYSLFLLPVFLIAIIYSVFELDVFNFHILGTHYLVVGLLVLTGGQVFFVSNTADILVTIFTTLFIVGLSIILFKNLKKESDQRVYIEKINKELEGLIKQRESLVHLVTHKVKGSFTRTKYIFAGILDGTFGDVSSEVKKWAEQGLESDNIGIQTVDLVLNASNLQKGSIKYEMKKIDFKEIVLKTINYKKGPIEAKGIKIETEIKDGLYEVQGDPIWLKEVVHNFLENSTKYTKAGTVTVGLERIADKVRFFIKDTGVGITEEDKKNLFTEGGRGKNSVKVNVDSTGYGLYSVKLIMDAHGGKVWAESEGQGKGSTFYAELNAVS